MRTWGSRPRPVVVLVHALGLTTASWGCVPELLAREHRVVGYDLRGHGESGHSPTGSYQLLAHARDLERVLETSLPPGGHALVVGNSFGGGVILAHAQHAGIERVSGAVFAGSGGAATTLPGSPAQGSPEWVQRSLRAFWLKLLRGASRASHHVVDPLGRWLVRRSAFEPGAPRDAVDQVRHHFMGTDPDVLARTVRTSGTHDPVQWAGALDVPALVLHGDRDPKVSGEAARRLTAALPQGRLVTIPGGGHMLALTRPEDVAEHVCRLLREIEGEARSHTSCTT